MTEIMGEANSATHRAARPIEALSLWRGWQLGTGQASHRSRWSGVWWLQPLGRDQRRHSRGRGRWQALRNRRGL